MKKIILIFIFLISLFELFGQNQNKYNSIQYGLFGHIIANQHKADFRALPEVPNCCPRFVSGSGEGITGGILFEVPIWWQFYSGFRLGAEYHRNTLTADEEFLLTDGNNVYVGLINHVIEPKFTSLFGELTFGLKPISGASIFFGARYHYYSSATFSQVERLVKPEHFGAFENGMRERNKHSGNISDYVKDGFKGVVGLSYEFPLNYTRTIRLAPEMYYAHSLSDVLSSESWRFSSVNLGLALKFSHIQDFPLLVALTQAEDVLISHYDVCNKQSKLIEPELSAIIPFIEAPKGIEKWNFKLTQDNTLVYEQSGVGDLPDEFDFPESILNEENSGVFTYNLFVRDNQGKEENITKEFNIEHKKYVLFTDITTYGTDTLGSKLKSSKLKLERTISTNIRPLLNYVFFDDGQSQIAERYVKLINSNNFQIETLHKYSTVEVYRNLLNILGKRMFVNPQSKIELVGCVSGLGAENNNKDLALARASEIKKYLMDIWNIDEKRILISVNEDLAYEPTRPSLPGIERHIIESAEENRRVEIYTSEEDAFLLSPVITTDTTVNAFPAVLVFNPEVKSNSKVRDWELNITQNAMPFENFSGTDVLPKELKIDFLHNISRIIDSNAYFFYSFKVENEDGLECSNQGNIDVDIINRDSTFFKYSLILFDYDSYEIGLNNQHILDMIRRAIMPDAEIEVYGYTDKLGDFYANLRLSKNRALNASKQIFRADIQPEVSLNNNASNIIISNRTQYFGPRFSDVTLSIMGYGETEPLLYDNNSPEGRFYSRTVTVTVKNKFQD